MVCTPYVLLIILSIVIISIFEVIIIIILLLFLLLSLLFSSVQKLSSVKLILFYFSSGNFNQKEQGLIYQKNKRKTSMYGTHVMMPTNAQVDVLVMSMTRALLFRSPKQPPCF